MDKLDELAMQIYMSGNCSVSEAYSRAKAEINCGIPKELEKLFGTLKKDDPMDK